MTIKVKNKSKHEVEVAVNQWGNDGNTSFFKLAIGASDTWNRTDNRGFVMYIKINGSQTPYYVQADSEVVIQNEQDHVYVTVDKVLITPASENDEYI